MYWKRFPEALTDRYQRSFDVDVRSELVFTVAEKKFEDVRSGRPLTIGHVMALFGKDLPFACNWTTPDCRTLAARMDELKVAVSIQRLGSRFDDLDLIRQILYCFRELSLTALILHHVYPTHFAMCSHHLASLLYITGPTVPEYYVRYCKELREWSKTAVETKDSAVKTEFALWTWYRLAYHGRPEDQKTHQQAFMTDSSVQERRAKQIAASFKGQPIGLLDLAQSFVEDQPIVAALIAWREFERVARKVLDRKLEDIPYEMPDVIKELRLSVDETSELLKIWTFRRGVVHQGHHIKGSKADMVVKVVRSFIGKHAPDLRSAESALGK